MELTILMPCLNEAETIVDCIENAKRFLSREKIQGEILIADNGSKDGSQQLARQHGARVIEVHQKGYGAALLAGIHAAAGTYTIMGDADASYDFSNLKPFMDKLRAGFPLVIGNRFKGGIQPQAMPFLNKYLGNPVLSFLGRLFFKCRIGDFHCGLRGFHRQTLINLQLRTSGMEFASEMVVKAVLNGIELAEVPTTLYKDGRSRPPHLRKWRDGWRHLRFLLSHSPRWMFLYPGLCFMTIGMALMSILIITPIQIGNLRLDIHTLLFASAFFIMGLQSICFAFFSKLIGLRQLHLAPSKKLVQCLSFFTLERGLVVGLTLTGVGLAGSIAAFFIWAQTQFGPLIPTQMMRLIIPSISLMIAGGQVILASFFMGQLIKD